MPQYLLDTSVLIAHLRGTSGANLDLELRQDCVVSYVTVGELLQGVKNTAEQKQAINVYSLFEIDWGSTSVSQTSHWLLKEYALSHGLGVIDALIAATALERDLLVVTLDKKHFACIDGLRVQSTI